jgi:hypothetical protein
MKVQRENIFVIECQRQLYGTFFLHVLTVPFIIGSSHGNGFDVSFSMPFFYHNNFAFSYWQFRLGITRIKYCSYSFILLRSIKSFTKFSAMFQTLFLLHYIHIVTTDTRTSKISLDPMLLDMISCDSGMVNSSIP